MKNTFKKGLGVLFDLNIGLWIGMLIADMAIPLVIRMLFGRIELVDRLFRVLGFLVVVTIVLFFRAYKSFRKARLTHKIENWKLTEIVVPVCIALIVQFGISSILGYGMYVTGAGYYLGWIIYNVDGAIFSITDVPAIYYICGTLMTYPFYIASIIIGSKIGFNSAYNSLPKED